MVQALHRALPERGIGVWSFDFPAHGDSPMGQEGLRVPFCMDDLETVEAWIRAKSPQVEVCYFASSFGAYITLLSLSRAPRLLGSHTVFTVFASFFSILAQFFPSVKRPHTTPPSEWELTVCPRYGMITKQNHYVFPYGVKGFL